jgi:hypothetical protein
MSRTFHRAVERCVQARTLQVGLHLCRALRDGLPAGLHITPHALDGFAGGQAEDSKEGNQGEVVQGHGAVLPVGFEGQRGGVEGGSAGGRAINADVCGRGQSRKS